MCAHHKQTQVQRVTRRAEDSIVSRQRLLMEAWAEIQLLKGRFHCRLVNSSPSGVKGSNSGPDLISVLLITISKMERDGQEV